MKKVKSDISVVFPYYNEEKTLPKTLELIKNQTLPPREVIFVNSSSTDSSSALIDRWIEENQSEIKFHNVFEGSNTPGSSKNVGIRRAKSSWIAFMDCGLLFEETWLEKQWKYIEENKALIVSGMVHSVGVGLIDTSAVAQTYGYKRSRPCVPSTLLEKDLFKKTGLFIENRRSGYDAVWQIALKKLGVERKVNEDVVIKYNGVNYGKSLGFIYKKSALYATASMGLKYYRGPYYNLILFFLGVFISLSFPYLIPGLFLGYLFLRGFLIPIRKSRGLGIFKEFSLSFLSLPLVGLTIDCGRIVGFTKGFFNTFTYFFNKTT